MEIFPLVAQLRQKKNIIRIWIIILKVHAEVALLQSHFHQPKFDLK